jgi:hypothetical protein
MTQIEKLEGLIAKLSNNAGALEQRVEMHGDHFMLSSVKALVYAADLRQAADALPALLAVAKAAEAHLRAQDEMHTDVNWTPARVTAPRYKLDAALKALNAGSQK